MSYNAELVPDLLGPDGPLAKLLQPYEDRPFQREMTLEVARLLEEGGMIAVEAPTGIGKSLGYGLPAALWAREKKGPVVVSTFTKALQEQLLRVEAPRIRTLVGDDLKVAVLKGRTNYVCRRRYELAAREAKGAKTQALLARLRDWVDTTLTGDLAECGETGSRDNLFLAAQVASDPDFCSHRDCTPNGGCFYKRARNRAQEADLLVVNHALLSIHLFGGAGPIPAFDSMIVDEAHSFLGVALDHLRRAVGSGPIRQLLEEAPVRGLPGWLREGEGDSRVKALQRGMENLEKEGRAGFGTANSNAPTGGESRERYSDPAELRRLCPGSFEPVQNALGSLEADVRGLESFAQRESDLEDPETGAWVNRMGRFRDRVNGMRTDLEFLLNPDPQDRDRVFWKEWEGKKGFTLSHSPLELGPHLVPGLEGGPSRVVFTSATLASNGDFGFFAKETGLGDRLHGLALPSPFDYAEQVVALAVEQGPAPGSPGWPLRTAETLHALLTDPGRNTLALFTSYRDLRQVEEVLFRLAAGAPYSVIAQAPGRSPSSLLDEFRKATPGLLLGTASFWQGIDLPGEELETLVVTRLPFGVPTEPRLAARSQRLEAEGGNPFKDLYLPEAVLRFKQGFGRLIRRRTDRGILAVLDTRLVTKGYGSKFRRALPLEVERVTDGAALAAAAAAWWRSSAASTPATPAERSSTT